MRRLDKQVCSSNSTLKRVAKPLIICALVTLGAAPAQAVYDIPAPGSYTALYVRMGTHNPASHVNTITYQSELPACLDSSIGAAISGISGAARITGSLDNAIGSPYSPAIGHVLGANCRTGSCTKSQTFSSTLTIDSTDDLKCNSGFCNGVTIPIENIGWVGRNGDTDLVDSGVYEGTATQEVVTITDTTFNSPKKGASPLGVRMHNQLTFSYDNATLLPAGRYTTTVRYVATGKQNN